MSDLLALENLAVQLPVRGEMRPVLHDVSLSIRAGESVGLVGESGSGKSMTARAIARLLPEGAVATGTLEFLGAPVLDLKGQDLRGYRSRSVSMIFQDPRAAINPVRRIGDFLAEATRTNGGMTRAQAERHAIELLGEVGIEDGARRLRQYPHELSGGLLQRVMIAAALASEPRLMIADEPTTALDVTSQAEVMVILKRLCREHSMALLFITHDLELAASACDRTVVMYAGSVVEDQASAKLHSEPMHPYTDALLKARPSIEVAARRLDAIPGQPLSAFQAPGGCAFAARCPAAGDECRDSEQVLRSVPLGRVRCCRFDVIENTTVATGGVS